MAEQRETTPDHIARLNEDRALLLSFHRGSDAAARELWARHAGALRIYAASLAGEQHADDIVQGVFLSVLKLKRRRVREVRDPAAWFCTLTRHAALNDRRARDRAERRVARGQADVVEAREPIEMDDVLSAMPPPCREALVLRHAYGFTLERLAEALGVSRSTAAQRYAQGLQHARKRLTTQEPKGASQHVG